MRLEIEDVCEADLQQLPDWSSASHGPDAGCRFCLYWEQPGFEGRDLAIEERESAKRRWFREVAAEFGCCGKIARAESALVGYSQFAPARYLPQAAEYACGPASDDAAFISCLYVHDQRGRGIGTALLQAVLHGLQDREVKSVETFARKGSANNPSGPLRFWLKHGFSIIREDADFALVRKELA
jgi:GNAT superfamily N-acetyltransferase